MFSSILLFWSAACFSGPTSHFQSLGAFNRTTHLPTLMQKRKSDFWCILCASYSGCRGLQASILQRAGGSFFHEKLMQKTDNSLQLQVPWNVYHHVGMASMTNWSTLRSSQCTISVSMLWLRMEGLLDTEVR